MKLKDVIISAIRDSITDEDIKDAVIDIVCNDIGISDCLRDSDTLKELIYENIEEAIKEELERY